MTTLTRWVLSHQRLVVGFWVAVTLVGFVTVSRITSALSQRFNLPGQEGFDTNQAILRTYGSDGQQPPLVPVIQLPSGTTVDSPGIKDQIAAAFAKIHEAAPAALVVSYATDGDRAFVSSDGRTTFGLVYPPGTPAGFGGAGATLDQVKGALKDVQIAGASFQLTGTSVLQDASGSNNGPGVLGEALLGGFGALIVLTIVFGSFIAVVPVVMAVVAIMGTFLLIGGITFATDVNFIVQFLVALIGLGVAIDYALLIVMRWREELARGKPNTEAVQRAMETAGGAVVHSGSTVAVGLVALIVLPVPFLRSLGVGGVLIPVVSVAVAITLLPVVLNTVGPRLDWPRRHRDEGASRTWTAWAGLVVRRRWAAVGLAALIMGALLAAATTININEAQASAIPSSGAAKDGLAILNQSDIGPGALEPTLILTPASDTQDLATRLSATSGVRGISAPSDPGWHRAATQLVAVFPVADANSATGRATLHRVSAAAHTVTGARVGGGPAATADFISAIYGSFPLMIALVALLTFVLLARAFRSLLLPLKAVLLNVLSVGAAWGVLVLVWQHGYGSDEIWGIAATGSITLWVPLMVFAFLFGLSMDYEVFILSRMREHYDQTGSTKDAVIAGIGRTGRLVTFAALILFLAFAALASGPGADIKIFATGIAAGIILDATIVRAMLVPALVALFGEWNWWLPAWPARILRVPRSDLAPSRRQAES